MDRSLAIAVLRALYLEWGNPSYCVPVPRALPGRRLLTAANTPAIPEAIGFLTDLSRWCDRTVLILDQASWNKSGRMRQFLADNRERIDYGYFPAGRPQPNHMERFWNVLKR